MKKIYLIFFLFVPFFLSAQQKLINTPSQPAQKGLQPANSATQASPTKQALSQKKPAVAQNSKQSSVIKHRHRSNANVIYGNEWINYSQQYYKIKIGHNGIYRIDSSTLAKAGIPVNTIDSRQYQVFFRGQQQYIYIRTRTTNLSETNGDYIEFYGQYNDGIEDSLIYYNIKSVPNPYYSLFSDTSTYYLTWSTSGGSFRMVEQTDTSFGSYLVSPYVMTPSVIAGRASSGASSYNRASYIDFQNVYQYSPGAYFPDGAYTPNDPRFTQNATWTTNWISYNSGGAYSPNTDNVYTGTGAPPAYMQTVVLGEENGDCTYSVYTNVPRNLWSNLPCDSFAASSLATTFPASDLNTPGFEITYYNNANNNTNIIAPTYIYIEYPHTLNLNNDSTFTMTLKDSAGGPTKAYLDFTNIYTYHSNSDSIRLYDFTNHNRFWVKPEGGGYKVLVPNSHGLQQCFLTSDLAIQKITTLTPVGISANGLFTNFSGEGDSAFIIVTHPSLWSGAQAYATYRRTYTPKHYTTVVADVEELYDQFGEGVYYSPLGIRRFCNYAINKWASPPSNLFLVGKGIHTPLFRSDTANSARSQVLVPSFGYPSSDVLFTNGLGDDTLFEPAIPTGRLAAVSNNDVTNYLTKVEIYESAPAALWMKNVAHFAGGNNANEENEYASFLDNFAVTISDTLFGGHVYLFQKSTAAPISGTLTDSVLNLINNGVSIMTFFGHAGGANWDESVDYPSDYSNYEKYPFMMADACFSGDIYQPIGDAISSVSEQWVLGAPGAIGFLASDYLGNPSQLDQYTGQIYDGISYRPFYRKPIGQIIQNTIGTLQNGANEFLICTFLEATLHGDPAIAINQMDSLPDYAVTPQSIYFTPANVTVLQDSFVVNVVVYNYAEALNQPVAGVLTRTFPDGHTHPYTFVINPPKYPYLYYADTVHIKVPVNDSNVALGAGINNFTVSVDLTAPQDKEITYNNNFLGAPVPLYITSEDITPIWPYDYAIIPADTVTLKASTNDPFAPQRTYIFEIDTSHSFNSPLFRSDTVTNSGGVIMVSPYANWGTSHFKGTEFHSSGGSKMPLNNRGKTQNASAVAGANVQNASMAKQNTAMPGSSISKASVAKPTMGTPSKKATAQAAGMETPVSAMPGNAAKKARGPIRESFLPNAVYYWRVRRDTIDSTGSYAWVNTSFQYIKGKNGWGQSNFYQYDNDEIFNDNNNYITFNSPPRGWRFNTQTHTLQCTTYGMLSPNTDFAGLNATQYTIDNFLQAYGGCQLNLGIYVAVIDKTTLQPWTTSFYEGHDFGEANDSLGHGPHGCGAYPDNKFIFWDNTAAQTQGLINMLKAVPAGDYILAYSWYEGAFKTSSGLTNASAVIAEFNSLGATQMPYHASTPGLDSVPWIFFVQKGVPGSAQQIYGNTSVTPAPPGPGINLSVNLTSDGTYGAITTPLIGPAAKYDSLSWSQHPYDKGPLTDSTRLNIIGIEPNGASKTLESNITPAVANMYISSINSKLFPYIQLNMFTKDAANRTPAQMNWWRVFYQPVPEIAMNPNVYTYYHADTLHYGDTLRFQTTVQNISDWPIDSTQLLAWTTNANNVVTPHNPTKLVKPLNPGDTAKVSFIYPDVGSNANSLQSVWLEINPEGYSDTRLEQYHFNNYAEKSFYSEGDKINPVLDVTFNGIHILNNDIVSAQPSILISFMDENKFLALNNAADFKVYLNPVGSPAQLIPYGPTLSFTPAVLPHNRCSLLLTPTLPDGTYQLTVQGTDIAGNLSANNSYTIDFQVINKPMISEVLNYPDPFSTSTRFVFILTGSEIPTAFEIQIMTVSGKVVKEITQDEIGPIHIGRNITQYAWDGTDQYGSRLANGVYLYRVISSINGQSIDNYSTPADKYFTKGWGKMYLMR